MCTLLEREFSLLCIKENRMIWKRNLLFESLKTARTRSVEEAVGVPVCNVQSDVRVDFGLPTKEAASPISLANRSWHQFLWHSTCFCRAKAVKNCRKVMARQPTRSMYISDKVSLSTSCSEHETRPFFSFNSHKLTAGSDSLTLRPQWALFVFEHIFFPTDP